MQRARFVLPLLFGWLPVAALFTALIVGAHGGEIAPAVRVALRMAIAAAVLGLVVHAATLRWPWPHPFRPGFVAGHALGAALFSFAWVGLNVLLEGVLGARARLSGAPGLLPYLVLGVWLYVMIAGISYATRATARAAELEALAARTQLATLRAQIHPHFLFNALHTVVQLIPTDPRAAAHAAEQLGEMLRLAIDERRDLVTLDEELAFVERGLALEALRFGARLAVRYEVVDEAREAEVPSFALQTLVENAVRHGAAPSVEPTTITIAATTEGNALVLRVEDSGVGLAAAPAAIGGSGLARLRERLQRLYGDAASLTLAQSPPHGTRATLVVPLSVAHTRRGMA